MAKVRTILIIDDNPNDRALAERELLKEIPPKSIHIEHIKNESEFVQALQSQSIHLVITDYYLHWTNGLDVLRRVKIACPHCPVIMFTASGNEDLAVQAMKEGLDDYISKKSKNFVRLRRAVAALLKSSVAMQKVGVVEAQLQTLLERLNVGVFRSTPDGRLIEANPACLRILGLQTLEEAENINLAEFYTSSSDRKRLLQSLYEKGYLHEKEIQLLRRDGQKIWVAVTEILDRRADGEIYIEGILEDISQRKEAEIALKESEERYRQLVEHSPFAIVVHQKGVIEYVNQAAVELLKAIGPEDMVGKNVMEFVHPDYQELVRQRMQAIAQDRKPLDLMHEKLICIDGSVIDAEVMALPVTFNGRPAAQVVIRDITRQVQMEEELKRREAQFRLLIENASDIIVIVDANGQLRYRSPSVRTLLGYEADEVQNMSVFDLVHPEDMHRIRNEFIRILRKNGAITPFLRFRLRHKNGEWRMLEAVAKNLLNDPSIRGIVVNARDVTDRLILEEQLYQSQKMEAIGRLAGGIAHDFNNLLTAIQGYADLLLHSLNHGDPLREDVEEIARATQRATALTRQLLTFSRKQILKPRIIHLNKIIEDMENMLSRLIGENIDLIIRTSPDLHAVQADPSQIEQVILNLAVNARDAMPEGGETHH
ncbi:MAG: PAS domain S-box protein [candidate division KSB1 bacterium]|nr:PAS domain S-box protein [candidate division KSB1 bacterium]